MKIQGPGSTPQTGRTEKKKKTSDSGGSFKDMVSSETGEAEKSSANTAITKVDALLAVQSVEDPTEKSARKRMRQRGENILRELDKIRMAMLTGEVTVGDVISVADVVASHREKITDPHLSSLLDEIDLRAQVEIAKIRVAAGRTL